jgi:hypothetical protein
MAKATADHLSGDLYDGDFHVMQRKQNRTPAQIPDWATAATEARRQRDAAAKVTRSEQQRQWRQAHAWSPKEFSQTRKV